MPLNNFIDALKTTISSSKRKTIVFSLSAAVLFCGFFVYNSLAVEGVNIGVATGGEAISIDTSSLSSTSAYTPLEAINISEKAPGQITAGIHTIFLPSGWEFNTSAQIIAIKGDGLTLASYNITPGPTSFSFTVNTPSTVSTFLVLSGMEVRPTVTDITNANGTITHSGDNIDGVTNGITSFGTLSTIPGTVTKIAFATQPGDTTYGLILSPQPVIKTQDQFGNDSTNGLGVSKTITIALTDGDGVLSGTTAFDIGTEEENGTVIFDDLAIDHFGAEKQLTATADGLAPAVSDYFEIIKKTLTATVTVNDKIYDGDNSAVIATVQLSGIEGDDDVSVDFSGAIATFADKNVDIDKVVTAEDIVINGADIDNYVYDGTATGEADIIKKEINVTPSAGQSKVYGENDPIFNYTADSLVTGDLFTGNLGRAGGEIVGNYAYTIGDLSAGGNYNLNLSPETFEIVRRPLNTDAIGQNKVYDANTTATVIFSDDRIDGDAITYSYTANFSDKNIGGGKSISVTGISIGGVAAGNYTLVSDTDNATADIIPKALTVGFTTNANKTYNGNVTAEITDRSLVGVIGGEVVDVTGGSATFADKNVGDNKVVTGTGFLLAGDDSGNYVIDSINTTIGNINQREITVTAVTDTKTYDGAIASDEIPVITNTPGSGIVTDPIVPGDTANFIQTFDNKNVGAGKTLTPSGIVTDENLGNNYDVTIETVLTGEITAKSINVTAQADNKVYDGTVSSAVAPVVGPLETGDSITTVSTQVYASKDVGTGKILTASGLVIEDGNGGSNYNVNYINDTTGVITAKELTVAGAATINKIYDGNVNATVNFGPASLVGVVAGEEGSVSLNSGAYSAVFDNKNVGAEKTVTISELSLAGAGASNYSLTQPMLNDGIITPKALTITATGVNKVYDATIDATVILSDNRIADDVLTFNYDAEFIDKNVGNDKVVDVTNITITGGTDIDNYTLVNETTTTTANITSKVLTATVFVDDKVYNGDDSAIITDIQLNEIEGDDAVSANFGAATADFEDAEVGNNKSVSAIGITLAGADKDNYSYDGTASGIGNILPIPIAVYVDDNYSIGNAGTHTFEYDAFNTIQAGISAVDVGGTVNVATGTYNGNLLIEKKLLLIGATGTKPVINGNAGTNYIVKINDADGVVIDNFEINGGGSATGANAFDYGILVNNSGSDTDSNRVEINNSVVRNIWKNGSNGIDIADSSYALIHNNTISSFHKRGIRYTNSTGKVYDNEIIGDNVDGTSRVQNLVNLWGGSNVEIYGNELHNALSLPGTPTWSSPGILVTSYGGGSDSYANIHDNEIYNCDTGVVVGSSYAVTDTSSADITHNNFHNLGTAINFEKNTVTAVIHTNKFASNIKSVDADGITGPASTNAEQNWWGSASGPATEMVYAGVDYRPWCTEETCTATDSLVPTPGISSTAGTLTNTSPIPIAVHFSEAVTDFGSADVFVGNGVASAVSGSGADYTFSIVPSGQGSVTVDIHANAAWDAVGNYNTAATQFSITYDTVASDVTLTNAPSSPTSEISANITVGGEGVVTYKYKLDEDSYGSFVSVGTHITLSGLTDGSHTISVIGKDAADNEQTTATQVTWAIDTVAPTATLTGTPSNPTNSTGATITVTGTDVVAYKYKLDSEDYGDETVIATPITLSGLAAGSRTLSVIGKDAAGNWQETATTHTWTIDTTAPMLDSHTPSVNAVGISPLENIILTFSEPVNVEDADVTISGGVAKAIMGSGTDTITIDPNSALTDNTTLTVTLSDITDLAGNTLGDYSWSFTTSVSYSITLNHGWNLISLPVVPESIDIADVLGSTAANIVSVLTYDASTGQWQTYHPNESDTGNLQTMTAGYAYWINYGSDTSGTLAGSGNLLLEGQNVPPSRKLAAGWNLIGYYQRENTTSVSTTNALANSLNNYWSLLAKYNSQSSSFSFLNDESQVNPGEGFWIFLNGVGGTEYNYTIGNIPD
jgi:hypothetical protein